MTQMLYDIKDRMPVGTLLLFALQELLAIMAATITVPLVVNLAVPGCHLSAAAALCGAGVGTLVYLLFTRFNSPVFLGSSFTFVPSMCAAMAGATSMTIGYAGLVIGAIMAGLVYCIIAGVVHFCGTAWVTKLMPPVVIGSTVALIGFSLASSAVANLQTPDLTNGSIYVCLICGFVGLFATILASVKGKSFGKIFPFIIGILAGYIAATIFFVIGHFTGNAALQIIDFTPFKGCGIFALPDYTIIKGLDGFKDITLPYLITLFIAYVPVGCVSFAEHIADHTNMSNIIGHNLLEEPGLVRTLLGDGVGSMVGAAIGGAPNTTYGECIGCVGITRNASTITTLVTAAMCIVFSYIAPLMAFLETIPSCVMGGICIALYGFIAVSGIKVIQQVDFNDNKNLFVASIIFIVGIGGLTITFGQVTLTTLATALILGIISNFVLKTKVDEKKE